MTPLETAFTFYLVTGDPRLHRADHLRTPPDHRYRAGAAGRALVALIWRNRRRVPRLPFVAVEESEVQVDGRRALPSHIHHGGESTERDADRAPPAVRAQLAGMGIGSPSR